MSGASAVDWQQWMARWDVMQQAYIPEREARFTLMLDVLEIVLPEAFVAVDIACGPAPLPQPPPPRLPPPRSLFPHRVAGLPATVAAGPGTPAHRPPPW